jgi:flagellar basal-body rod protein FlgB
MDKIEIGKKLFDQTMGVLNQSLDVRTARHRVLSSNVANAETPNYASKDLPFQKILERSTENSSLISLRKTHPQHFPEPGSSVMTTDWSSEVETKTSEEGVNIDQEMAKLAENNLMFQAGVQSLVKKFEALKITISEGR